MSSIAMSQMSSIFVTEEVIRNMSKVAEDVAVRVVRACSERYGFDADEAIRELGLNDMKMSIALSSTRKEKVSSRPVATKATESSIRMPYSGECNEDGCHGLRYNAGLYTQCKLSAKVNNLCKTCQNSADRNDGTPEYGTTDMRKEQDMFAYVDPKGRKQVAYAKVMEKFGYTKDQVLEEAGKLGITIDERHFDEVTVEAKKSAPKSAKIVKEPSSTGKKGRPKKPETVVEIDEGSEEVTDLFASLVLENAGKSEKKAKKPKVVVDEEEDEAEAAAAKIAVEKAMKKKAREEEKVRAEEKARAEEEKKARAEEEKKAAAKDLELKKKSAKAAEKPKVVVPESDDEEEEERVTKITENGVKYLKSSISGAIYDYKAYTERDEPVVVGRWNEETGKIVFAKAGDSDEEEEEEEYEEESEVDAEENEEEDD